MKSIIFSAAIIALSIASCSFSTSSDSFNTGKDKDGKFTVIEESGPETVKKESLPDFDRIENETVATIIYTQDTNANPGIEIKGPKNIVNIITYNVSDNGNLTIDAKRGYKIRKTDRNKKIEIRINSRSLSKIENNGVGDIQIKSLSTTDFSLEANGVGDTNISSLKIAQSLKIENSGVGSVNANNVSAKSVSIENDGVGSIQISGNAQFANFENSGVGSIEAGNLLAKNVTADNSGVGSIECNASATAVYSKSGVGSVDIKGNAKITKK